VRSSKTPFDLTMNFFYQVPKKVTAKIRKDGHAFVEEDDGELLLLDGKPELSRNQLKTTITPTTSPSKGKGKAIKTEDSETEDDEDEFVHVEKSVLPLDKKPPVDQHGQKATLSSTDMDVDDEVNNGRAPGRIIGTTDPLRDLRKNLERGDVVSKAVEDMGYVIGEIVMKPFAGRRKDELLECLREMRNVALKVRSLLIEAKNIDST
jgi:ATP-dependent DNA helicase 2 subunit 2